MITRGLTQRGEKEGGWDPPREGMRTGRTLPEGDGDWETHPVGFCYTDSDCDEELLPFPTCLVLMRLRFQAANRSYLRSCSCFNRENAARLLLDKRDAG